MNFLTGLIGLVTVFLGLEFTYGSRAVETTQQEHDGLDAFKTDILSGSWFSNPSFRLPLPEVDISASSRIETQDGYSPGFILVQYYSGSRCNGSLTVNFGYRNGACVLDGTGSTRVSYQNNDCSTTSAITYADTNCNVETQSLQLSALTMCQTNHSRANTFAWSANLNCIFSPELPVTMDSVLYTYRADSSQSSTCSEQVLAFQSVSTGICLPALNHHESYVMNCSASGNQYDLGTYVDNNACHALTYSSEVVNVYTPTCPAVGYSTTSSSSHRYLAEQAETQEKEMEEEIEEVAIISHHGVSLQQLQDTEDEYWGDNDLGFSEFVEMSRGITVNQIKSSTIAIEAVNTWWITYTSYGLSYSYYATRNYVTSTFYICSGTVLFTTCDSGGSSGNYYTAMRLYLGSQLLAAADFSCGLGSQISYTFSSCNSYTLRMGCYYYPYCTGVVTASSASDRVPCPSYTVSNTNSAQQNYATCTFYACSGTATISTCAGTAGGYVSSGDTYLRLYLGSTQLAQNDDAGGSCGTASIITYTLPSTCQTYSILQGCSSSGSCSATTDVFLSATTISPSASPTQTPTYSPSAVPSQTPTFAPSATPTYSPSAIPTATPTFLPSATPSVTPSCVPTAVPSAVPTQNPTLMPSAAPTLPEAFKVNTIYTVTQCAMQNYTLATYYPPTMRPTSKPSSQPHSHPSSQPSMQPSSRPTQQPSESPTSQPSEQPTSVPSTRPTDKPSTQPSQQPSMQPSSRPSTQPISSPSCQPSVLPTLQPSSQPTNQPNVHPSSQPSRTPSSQPVACPTTQPSSSKPSTQPTLSPEAAETFPPQASNKTTIQSAGAAAASAATVSTMLIGIIVAGAAVIVIVLVGCWLKRDALCGIASSSRSSSLSSDGENVSQRSSSSKSQMSENPIHARGRPDFDSINTSKRFSERSRGGGIVAAPPLDSPSMLASTPRTPTYSSRFTKRLSKKAEEIEMKDMRGSSPMGRISKSSSNNESDRASSASPTRPTMFNSSTAGARNALANPRRSSLMRSESLPRDRPDENITKPPPETIVLRKTNGPRQDEEGFDFHDMYPDNDHNEAEKVDLNRVSLSDMNEFQVRGEERGVDDDFDFRRIKKSWKTNEVNNKQQAGKLAPAQSTTNSAAKGLLSSVSSAKMNSSNTAMKQEVVKAEPRERSEVDDYASSPPPKANFSEANPMAAAAARRSNLSSRSSSFSESDFPARASPVVAAVAGSPSSIVIAPRPRRQSSINTMQQSSSFKK